MDILFSALRTGIAQWKNKCNRLDTNCEHIRIIDIDVLYIVQHIFVTINLVPKYFVSYVAVDRKLTWTVAFCLQSNQFCVLVHLKCKEVNIYKREINMKSSSAWKKRNSYDLFHCLSLWSKKALDGKPFDILCDIELVSFREIQKFPGSIHYEQPKEGRKKEEV